MRAAQPACLDRGDHESNLLPAIGTCCDSRCAGPLAPVLVILATHWPGLCSHCGRGHVNADLQAPPIWKSSARTMLYYAMCSVGICATPAKSWSDERSTTVDISRSSRLSRRQDTIACGDIKQCHKHARMVSRADFWHEILCSSSLMFRSESQTEQGLGFLHCHVACTVLGHFPAMGVHETR